MPETLPQLDEECFFIAPIGQEGSPERERSDGILEFIVDRAAHELNLTAIRADQIAEPGQITLQVIDHILGARAAVADVTGLNPNVFYELAVRHTARLPVAIIAEKGCNLPFDIAQMRTIFFESTSLRSADQCRIDIVAQLKQALDRGAVDSPIATSIDVRTLAGGSTAERNIAEIITTMEEIVKGQRDIASNMAFLRLRKGDWDSPVNRSAIRHAIAAMKIVEDASMKNDIARLRLAISELRGPLRYIARKYDVPIPQDPTDQLRLTDSVLADEDEESS